MPDRLLPSPRPAWRWSASAKPGRLCPRRRAGAARRAAGTSCPSGARRWPRCGVETADNAAEALADRAFLLSLVTADAALDAARDYAPLLPEGALWCDMNSVAPDTKRAAAAAIEAAGGRYVDVAVMAPVDKGLAVPLLVSGPHALAAQPLLEALGFTNVRVVGDEVGRASAIKMIRSVMVKGLEALTLGMRRGGRGGGRVRRGHGLARRLREGASAGPSAWPTTASGWRPTGCGARRRWKNRPRRCKGSASSR